MDWVTIQGVKPYDGRWEFDLVGQELTTREWGWIKRFSGYLPLTIDDGFAGADPELFAAFAVIALVRGGQVDARNAPDMYERLQDAPFGATISLESDEEAPAGVNPPTRSSGSNGSDSGRASPTSSETSASPPARTGTRGLATSPSDPPTSLS